MRVTEVFYSLQGEGTRVGVPSVFVRLAGCSLRCRWCDTAYAWDYWAGEELDPGQIAERVGQWSCGSVVLTGGEPMMGPDGAPRGGFADLTARLRALGKHVTIETAGVLFMPDLCCDLLSISPKLGNSASSSRQGTACDPAVLARLIAAYSYQFKFVIESAQDLGEVRGLLERLPSVDSERVLLMPQARTREELLARGPMVAELCRQTGFRFCDRLHVFLWGNERGR
ncbi:MAG: 7-carboxy-7-deazaguanine synthase QueE [Phycisphaerae bacterium]|nr:7-carboxy-7-deazaguanine synthase QueE [Phycisphaerae bacterium]